MTDEQVETETPRRGRPKGSRNAKRHPLREPVHRGRDEEPYRDQRYEFYPHESKDKFYIPKDITDSIAAEWGQALMWMALEILGQPNEFIASRRRNQWEEVRAGDFEGQFDHFGIKDGIIRIEGMALFRQPIEKHRKARAYDKRQADAPIVGNIRKHSVEGIDVSMPGGGDHPSALAKNRHVRSYEPGPKIPPD